MLLYLCLRIWGRYQREDVTLNSKVHMIKALRLWNYYLFIYYCFVNTLLNVMMLSDQLKMVSLDGAVCKPSSDSVAVWIFFLNLSKLQNLTWTQTLYYKICPR